MPTLFTTKQVSDYLKVSDTTVRTGWSGEFADYLSEYATPGKGQERRFTPEDVGILYTVSVMRQQGVDFPDIHKALAAGERIEPPVGERATPAPEEEGDQAAVAVAAFQSALSSYEARVNKLESRLEEVQTARLDAEIRAARAETELKTIQGILENTPAPPASLAAAVRSWWQSRRVSE